jgi:hypothetical protein
VCAWPLAILVERVRSAKTCEWMVEAIIDYVEKTLSRRDHRRLDNLTNQVVPEYPTRDMT